VSTVLHYVQRWLPLSEQFVDGQISHSRHRAVVVARERVENRDVFPQRPLWSLSPVLRATPRRLQPLAIRAVLSAIAWREGIGVVHAHFGYRVHDVLALARRRSLPLVVSVHGHDVTAFAREWPEHYDAVFASAAAVVVPSRFLATRVEELGAPPAIVHVIPSGVDTELFAPRPLPDGPPTAAFIGRFVEKKGVDVLLAAWPAVRAAVPDARLVLLGYGPLLGEVASDAGVNGVELVQPDPRRRASQVRDVIAGATVVVSPSRIAADGDAESLVLANVEAQASGRGVVTTRHGGIPEFVTAGETALVVEEGDAGALAEALITVLADRDLAARLGAAGPARASSLDVRVCSARVDDLYDALVSTPVASG
jgi:colanic acid/amylovoran biosynthesis glycosyltransferase